MNSDFYGKLATLNDRWEAMTGVEQEAVKALHATISEVANNPSIQKNPTKFIEDCEFVLQGLWGFERNSNFHSHWIRISGCTCPTMDNVERLGFGRIISGGCPWHATSTKCGGVTNG